MNFGSVCSGIEAASVAWHRLGWRAAFLSEIERFPCAVLAHHYPSVPNFGDMTRFMEWPDANIDVLVGGTPCQSFSVAGLRKGLDDPRGNLMLTYGAIAGRYRPRWLVWENVPGVLSSNGGRDFGAFLGMLGELGYGFAYRVLDAQHFGVPQRRRRVFVVGCLGDWRRAAAVLFERHSMSGDSPPSRESGKVAPIIPSRSTGGGGLGTDFDCDGGLIARAVSLRGREGGATAELGDDVQNCLRASGGGGDKPHVLIHADQIARCVTAGEAKRQDWETCNFVAHTLKAEGFDASEDGTGRGTPLVPAYGFNARQDPDHWRDRTGPLDTDGGTQAVAFAQNSRDEVRLEGGDGQRCGAPSTGGGKPGQGVPMVAVQASQSGVRLSETVGTLDANYGSRRHNGVMSNMQVRRLTPVECERLQGFQDDYTRIPWKAGYWSADKHAPEVCAAVAEQCPDGPRYKALGNSWAVPVVRWIGRRIDANARN